MLCGSPEHSLGHQTATFCLRVAVLANAWLAWLVVKLARDKAYAIDEYNYAHISWTASSSSEAFAELFTHGRQFVTALLPLPYVLLGGDDPGNMILVRVGMVPYFAIAIAAAAYLASRVGGPAGGDGSQAPRAAALAAAITVLLALGTRRLVWHGIEIRPDILAIMLTLLAVALLYQTRWPARISAFAAGVLLFLACFASTKALVYGAVFAPIFMLDLLALARGERQVLRSALFFAAGFALGVLGLVAVLAITDSFATFWAGFYLHPVLHEKFYPDLAAARYLEPLFQDALPLFMLAAVGAAAVATRCITRALRHRVVEPDWLLLGLLGSTWASYLIQKAPYAYSLIPGILLLALFAGRGAAMVMGLARLARPGARTWVCASWLIAMIAFAWASTYRLEPKHRNDRQIAVQRIIHQLVAPRDTVYDMSGTYVYRPRAHRFVFIDQARKIIHGETLPGEVEEALIAGETMLFVYDLRFHSAWRNTSLGRFILKHYQRYNNDLFVWGRRWPGGASVDDEFLALKDGRYFVHPPDLVSQGALRIDGRPVQTPIFELARGPHQVQFQPTARSSPRASRDLYLIWLPRDGRVFDPTRRHPPYSLGAFVLP